MTTDGAASGVRDTGEVLLSCVDVGKSYGGVRAVRDVSLEVRAGEIVGLVGPNGAGKTTLVDVITGQQQANTGDIRIGAIEMTGSPSRRARLAGFSRTFQHPQLALDMTVRENILIGGVGERFGSPWRIFGQAVAGAFHPGTKALDRRIAELANDLGIHGLHREVADLTLGEQRMVEVARALLRRPRVLLLDEPFAGGDPRGVSGMTNALSRIVEQGCAVLVVDHNVDIVASLVDRLVLMDQGAVAFQGTPAQALASAQMRAVYFGGTAG
ncbi:ABC transporter ATP-binding protein [Nakamurella lactea]|uniref:ABC transporter ATP-binding protein n=1 Tax=Nakamurella lactea TaxID=459515 RepID=UPI00041C5F9F|nr:ATP-binding cassette domain-containing protein [Nakamurella lactea]